MMSLADQIGSGPNQGLAGRSVRLARRKERAARQAVTDAATPPGARCALPNYSSRRPSMAFNIVISSAYSRSLPTGTPMAIRVQRTPSGFRSFAR